MSSSRCAAVFGGAVLALGIVACQEKDDFETCAVTTPLQADCKTAIAAGSDQCSEDEVFCFDSCIVKDHPQCVDGPCVLFELGQVGTTQPTNSGATAFCTIPCNGMSCPTDTTCRALLSLKTSCTKDSDCTANSPWARCESQRFCETSRVACEVDADCGDQRCIADDAAAKSCTWKFCIPDKYAAGS